MNLTQIRRGNLYVLVYFIAAMMIVLPLSELTLAAWPLRPGAIQWRFGLLGLSGNTFLGPMTGLALLALAAALLEHRLFLRSLAVIALLLAALAASGWAVFVLDALQLRGAVKPQAVRGFEVAAAKALVGLSCTTLLCLWIGVGGWIASRGNPPGSQQATKKATRRSVLIAGTPVRAGSLREPEVAERASV